MPSPENSTSSPTVTPVDLGADRFDDAGTVGTDGLGRLLGVGKRFSRTATSMGLTRAATTRTSTWFGPGSGRGTSS